MENILSYILGVLIIIVIAKILLLPLKIIWKLFINGLAGLALLFIFNLLGSSFGFYIETSPLNSVLAGIFGVPGVIVLFLSGLA